MTKWYKNLCDLLLISKKLYFKYILNIFQHFCNYTLLFLDKWDKEAMLKMCIRLNIECLTRHVFFFIGDKLYIVAGCLGSKFTHCRE